VKVFVYGTLKEGFRNFHVNRGTRLPGEFVTEQALPLYVIGEFGLPWLVHDPGQGHRVVGQVFEVDAAALAQLDVLERVNDPDWYTRCPLRVRPRGGGEPVDAVAYFGSPARLRDETVHHGPIAEYTSGHQALYQKHL
jgi:gamma-glutamylaminecyclotransferase